MGFNFAFLIGHGVVCVVGEQRTALLPVRPSNPATLLFCGLGLVLTPLVGVFHKGLSCSQLSWISSAISMHSKLRIRFTSFGEISLRYGEGLCSQL